MAYRTITHYLYDIPQCNIGMLSRNGRKPKMGKNFTAAASQGDDQSELQNTKHWKCTNFVQLITFQQPFTFSKSKSVGKPDHGRFTYLIHSFIDWWCWIQLHLSSWQWPTYLPDIKDIFYDSKFNFGSFAILAMFDFWMWFEWISTDVNEKIMVGQRLKQKGMQCDSKSGISKDCCIGKNI